MRFYPIFLHLEGRRCVVVGGGRVAERKVRGLLRAGASVQVISPSVTPRLATWGAKNKIRIAHRPYRREDLAGTRAAKGARPFLVFAATNDPAAQEAIRKEAEAAGALVNLADDAGRSSFLVPASFSRSDLHVAISTSGASPALARLLRRQLQESLGREYRALLAPMRTARQEAKKAIPDQKHRARFFRRLVSSFAAARPPAGKPERRNSKVERRKRHEVD